MVEIPQDIIDSIIEAVGNDTYLLKECALVSSSFLLPSRKYIFSKLSFIGRPEQVCNWQRLYQFLVENPVVQSFVRSITIEPDCYTLYEPLNHPSLIAILRLPFCCLESFSIDNMRTRVSLNWDNFSSELKDTLSTVIHSSTLKTLHLSKINMPILLFLDINLSKLELTAFLLRDLGVEQSRLLTLAASKGGGAATASLSHTVVDHCVWNFFKPVYGPTVPIFLPFMCRLRVLDIYIDPSSTRLKDFDILSFLIRSLRLSLTSPPTLEHLKLGIVFTSYDYRFFWTAFFDELSDCDFWRHLDSIVTHPAGSRLQRVDIDIYYTFQRDDNVKEPDNNEVSEPILDALPSLRKKGILFVKAIG